MGQQLRWLLLGPQLSNLELPLDLLEVGEAVFVKEPVLQDLVGRGGGGLARISLMRQRESWLSDLTTLK
jgi:hypothetical protein